jgi:hypothetical protein
MAAAQFASHAAHLTACTVSFNELAHSDWQVVGHWLMADVD